VFRWPIELTALSYGSQGVPRPAVLEVTPRGALFTLAALSHVGHPAHLALADAYLKGQVRLTSDAGIGEDTRLVVSALAAPLVAAYELGLEQLSLADLVLLPRGFGDNESGGRSPEKRPVRGPDSPYFLLRSHDGWAWVRAAERFGVAGCTGVPQPGQSVPWHDAVVELPRSPHAAGKFGGDLALSPIEAEVRHATIARPPSDAVLSNLRASDHARFAWPHLPALRTDEPGADPVEPTDQRWSPASAGELRTGPRDRGRIAVSEHLANTVAELAEALTPAIQQRRLAAATLASRGREVQVSLVPELDGYLSLCLLPPADVDPTTTVGPMRELAWATIEALLGRPLPERRTEPIAIRLIADDGRSTTLDVGTSVVIGRNQQVFAAWVGSDGRVMLRLFPPGGMTSATA
jgi:hypothetical protein